MVKALQWRENQRKPKDPRFPRPGQSLKRPRIVLPLTGLLTSHVVIVWVRWRIKALQASNIEAEYQPKKIIVSQQTDWLWYHWYLRKFLLSALFVLRLWKRLKKPLFFSRALPRSDFEASYPQRWNHWTREPNSSGFLFALSTNSFHLFAPLSLARLLSEIEMKLSGYRQEKSNSSSGVMKCLGGFHWNRDRYESPVKVSLEMSINR